MSVGAEIQAERISESLGGRRSGSGWMALCPAHEDRNPSLSISVKNDRCLVHCQAGCDQDAVIEELKRRDLWEARPQSPIPPPRAGNGRKPDARFIYADPDTGEVVAYHERFEFVRDGKRQKSCPWYQPNGTKGLEQGRGAKILPPWYRSERLAQAPADQPILVVEGEKCVRAAESLGFVAICGPFGAKSELQPRTLELLTGRTVWLLPDNDKPGKEHMERVAEQLKMRAGSVRWIALPGLANGEDLVEWIAAGGTADTLRALALVAPLADERKGAQPRTITLSKVKAEKVRWLWHPYVPLGKLTLIDGDPGVGKSWLVCDIARAVTRGQSLPEDRRADTEPGRILFLAGEDGLADTIKPRLESMDANCGLVEAMIGVYTEENGEITFILDQDGLTAIKRAIRQFRPLAVIIDPLVAYIGGKVDTGKGAELRAAILRPLTSIAAEFGCSIICTRHLTKVATGTPLYRGQGSIDFIAAARSGLIVQTDPNDRTRAILAHNKSSLGPEGPSQAFHIDSGPHGHTLYWDGRSDLSKDDLMAPLGEGQSSLDEAKLFLLSTLHDGAVSSRDITRDAKDAGISEMTLRRAKAELDVRWERRGVRGIRGGGEVVLTLPQMADAPPPPIRRFPVPLNLVNTDTDAQVNLHGVSGVGTPETATDDGPNDLLAYPHVYEQVDPNQPSEGLTNEAVAPSPDDQDVPGRPVAAELNGGVNEGSDSASTSQISLDGLTPPPSESPEDTTAEQGRVEDL